MADHPDAPALALLAEDHRRYADWIRDLLAGATPTVREMVTLSGDVSNHLRAVEGAALPGLDAEGERGRALAARIREQHATIRRCLALLRASEARGHLDTEALRALARELSTLSRDEDASFRPWRGDMPMATPRVTSRELAGIAIGMLGGAAFGTLLGPLGALLGAAAGALVPVSSVLASRAGHRYGWSTERAGH